MRFTINGRTHIEPGIEVHEYQTPRPRFFDAPMTTLIDRMGRWWWRMWTGYDSLTAIRRALEQDVRRHGGRVDWEDSQ